MRAAMGLLATAVWLECGGRPAIAGPPGRPPWVVSPRRKIMDNTRRSIQGRALAALIVAITVLGLITPTLHAQEWTDSELSWSPGAVTSGWSGWWFRYGTEWFQFTFTGIDTNLIDNYVTVEFNLSVTNRASGEAGLDGLIDVVINPGLTPTTTYTDVLLDNVDPNNLVCSLGSGGSYNTNGSLEVPKSYIVGGQLVIRVLRHPDTGGEPVAPVGTEQPIDMSTTPPTVPPDVYEDDDAHTVHLGVTCEDGAGGHVIDGEVVVVSDKGEPGGGLVEAVGGTSDDVFHDMVETSDGGVVAVGYTESFGAGGQDVLLVKFDRCGDFVWRKTLGGSGDEDGRSIIEIDGGDLVVTGFTSSVGGAGEHLFISRFNSLGVEAWTRILYENSPLVDYETRGYDVIMDSSDRLVVTGTVFSTDLQQYSLLLARFNLTGGFLDKSGFRVNLLPQWDHWGESLVEGCGSNYLIVGGSVKPSSGDQAAFFLRVGTNMVLAQARWWQEGSDAAVGHCITLNQSGQPLITGQTGDDLFVSRCDCDGSPVAGWQKKFTPGTTEGYSIIEESVAPYDLVIAGQSGSTGQVLVSRWTADLDLVDGRFLTWGGGETETGYSVAEDSYHRLWIAGETSSWGAGGADGLVAKLDTDGHACILEMGVYTTPATWNPTESALNLVALPLNPLVDQQWVVASADATPVMDFVCDDECEEECCFDDGTCAFLTPDDCEAANGTPQGPGTTCSPTGACCLPDGSCVDTTEVCCLAAAGAYMGDGIFCQLPQACCMPDHSCAMLDPLCCGEEGGLPQGFGTSCTSAAACCMPDGSCIEVDPECCDEAGGFSAGVGQPCLGDKNGDGKDDACHKIPTVSEWGLIIMTLLLLTAGTIVFSRRYRAVTT